MPNILKEETQGRFRYGNRVARKRRGQPYYPDYDQDIDFQRDYWTSGPTRFDREQVYGEPETFHYAGPARFDREQVYGEPYTFHYAGPARFDRGQIYGEPETFHNAGQDWAIPGPYTGMGPSNYQRPDQRIHEDICDRIMQHGMIDAHNMRVEVAEGEVTLSGEVNSRRAKRMAEDVANTVSGVKDVHNQLRVENTEQERNPHGS